MDSKVAWASQVAQWVKNPPTMQETQGTWVPFLGWEDPLEEGMATQSSILVWRILRTEEPGGYSPCGRKESGKTDVTEQVKAIYSYFKIFSIHYAKNYLLVYRV